MTDRALAHLLLRLYLAVNIGMHGVVRVPSLGGFADGLVQGFAETPLPAALVRAFAYGLVPIEIALGVLLLLGVRLRWTLAAGILVMTALTFGTVLRQQWDIAGLQLIYALAYAALLFNLEHARWTLPTGASASRAGGDHPASTNAPSSA